LKVPVVFPSRNTYLICVLVLYTKAFVSSKQPDFTLLASFC